MRAAELQECVARSLRAKHSHIEPSLMRSTFGVRDLPLGTAARGRQRQEGLSAIAISLVGFRCGVHTFVAYT
jgi:hypothetical protein